MLCTCLSKTCMSEWTKVGCWRKGSNWCFFHIHALARVLLMLPMRKKKVAPRLRNAKMCRPCLGNLPWTCLYFKKHVFESPLILESKHIGARGRKAGHFFSVGCQLINIEGMRELESHHLAASTVFTDSSKNHQWMTKPLSELLLGNRAGYFHNL